MHFWHSSVVLRLAQRIRDLVDSGFAICLVPVVPEMMAAEKINPAIALKLLEIETQHLAHRARQEISYKLLLVKL